MRYTRNKIYDLLPAIYRQKDIENGGQLKALLDVIAEKFMLIESDIERLYDNWFIETCDEWVVPYIADLLKSKIPYPVSSETYSQRKWVANIIDYRRRKGTHSMLEQLSRDITGLNSKSVEFFERLITTPNINHVRPNAVATPDLRNITNSKLPFSPAFDSTNHIVDTRDIGNHLGYYNVSNIGIFLWRIQALPVYDAPAYNHCDGKYSFNQLGFDEPLYNDYKNANTIPIDKSTEINYNVPITRNAMRNSTLNYYCDDCDDCDDCGYTNSKDFSETATATASMQNKSIQIRVNGAIKKADEIVVSDLSGWSYHQLGHGKVAVDPDLGRILFPINEIPKTVNVSYYYGFNSKMGGGFYARPMSFSLIGVDKSNNINTNTNNNICSSSIGNSNGNSFFSYKISKKQIRLGGTAELKQDLSSTIGDAVNKWVKEGSKNAIFEIVDSEFYDEDVNLRLEIPSETTIAFMSSQGNRPVIRLASPLKIKGKKNSSIVFDGLVFDLLFANKTNDENCNILLNVLPGDLGNVVVNHCTLVPSRKNDAQKAIDNNDGDDYNSNDGLRLLFKWSDDLCADPGKTKRLRRFIHDNFENLKWILLPETKIEFVSSDMLKIFLPTNRRKPFITLEKSKDKNNGSKVALYLNYMDDANSCDTLVKGELIYDFVLQKDENGELFVFLPKVSILITGIPVTDNNGDDCTINDDNCNKRIGTNDKLLILLQNTICGRVLTTYSSDAGICSNDSIIDGRLSNNSALLINRCRIENSTILGSVHTNVLELANNSLFFDTVIVKRRQVGCVRHSYLPLDSQTPQRYRCQPEYFNSMNSKVADNGHGKELPLNLVPQFTSLNYGDPGYAQLSKDISKAIFQGADNGSEMGVFNNSYHPQRIENLRSTIDEYLRFGFEVGVFLAN